MSGLSSKLFDDRSSRITIIRKSEVKPTNYELNKNQRKSLDLMRSKIGKQSVTNILKKQKESVITMDKQKNNEERFRAKLK